MSVAQGISGGLSGAAAGATVGGPVGAAIGGAVGLIGGIFTGNSQKKKAEKLAAEVDALIAELGLPPETAKPLLLEKFKVEGLYTPELEESINLAEFEAGKIKEDPSLRESRMGALRLLSERADAGLTAEDRASFNKLRNAVATQEQGRQQGIIQEMQQRGQGGGGAELAARLLSSQAATNRAAEGGDEIAAAASRNALEAASRYGTEAGNIREQDFSTAQAIANAKDLRNKMLYENSVALQQRNIGSKNQAQLANLQRSQQVSDANTGMTNAEQARQAAAKAEDFRNKMAITEAKINARTGAYGRTGQAERSGLDQFSNIMTGISTALPSVTKAVSGWNTARNASKIKTDNADLLGLEDEVMGKK